MLLHTVLMYIVKKNWLTSPLAQKSNGENSSNVTLSVVFFVSSNFPKKKALTKASKYVFYLDCQFKGWVADCVAVIDVYFLQIMYACKNVVITAKFSEKWRVEARISSYVSWFLIIAVFV